jgi:hypothetical protein
VAAALTVAGGGDGVVVTARSRDAAEAWALASAAGAVLASRPDLAPGAVAAPADGASLRVVAAGPASPPTIDPAPEAAARLRLLETLLLGLGAGVGLALAVDAWAARRTGAPVRAA